MTTRREATQQDAGDLSSLVALAARGDERAWERLVGLYARRVYAMAQSRLRRPDLAEEVTQSVFVTVAIKLKDDAYTEQGRFEAWLFRVTMNRVRDTARRMKRQASPVGPEVAEQLAAPAPTHEPAPDFSALRSAMETLSEPDREVIELRHHGQMGFKDIAALLGEPVGTVLARHHRALRKLRAVMESDAGDGKDRGS